MEVETFGVVTLLLVEEVAAVFGGAEGGADESIVIGELIHGLPLDVDHTRIATAAYRALEYVT
jgi:hypothetical protein